MTEIKTKLELINYPLIKNKKWFAENGTVHNEADEDFKIAMIHVNGSYSSLPYEIAEMIANMLNQKI